MQVAGKYAVVVGGFGGIGMACCRELLLKGLKGLMILDDFNPEQGCAKLEKLRDSSKCAELAFEKLDLTKGKRDIRRTLKTAVEKFGSFDLLVNNSGIIDERKPKRTIDINLTGLIETTLAAVPMMSWAGCGKGGLIVNVASVLGLEPGHFLATYTASKHGVIGFTKSLAHDHYFDTTGIMHVAFCPGFTITPLIDDLEGRDTFDFSKPITRKFQKTVKRQTAEECGYHFVCMLEQATNGSIWISDLGELKQVKLHQYWAPSFDSPKSE